MSLARFPLLAATLALLAALPGAPASAWHDGGHVVVARIAYDRLTPEARAEADRLVAVLAEHEPRRADLVTAAVWLDDVKRRGWRAFDRWHYINLPYNAGGLASVPGAGGDHALEAVRQAMATLAAEDAPDLAKAFSLRVLLHVVADLHQPMHCVDRFVEPGGGGDRGGNDFLLADGNLHAYWDDAAGLLGELDAASAPEEIAAAAAELVDAVPAEALPGWRQLEVEAWAQESFRLATTVAYVGLVEGREPTESYRLRTQLVARRRLVTAGYRLGLVLDELLGGAELGAAPGGP